MPNLDGSPTNAFDEQAPEEIERQKRALVATLAQQGSYGAQQIANRQVAAQGLADNAQAATPAAAPMDNNTKALYDVFTRDASQSTQQSAANQAQTLAANKMYMDQVAAAIPMQRADAQSYTDAQKKAYDDRAAQRELERQQAEAQLQATKAAAARAASAESNKSVLQQLLEKRDAEKTVAGLDWETLQPTQRTPSAAAAVGKAGGMRSMTDAAKAVGFDPGAATRRWITKEPSSFRAQDDALATKMREMLTEAQSSDASWGEVMAAAKGIAEDPEVNLDYKALQPWLAMYSQMWGVDDKDWLEQLSTGGSRSAATPGVPSKAPVYPQAVQKDKAPAKKSGTQIYPGHYS